MEKIEEFYWEKNGLINEIAERLIINVESEDEGSFQVSDNKLVNEEVSDVPKHHATDTILCSGVSTYFEEQ